MGGGGGGGWWGGGGDWTWLKIVSNKVLFYYCCFSFELCSKRIVWFVDNYVVLYIYVYIYAYIYKNIYIIELGTSWKNQINCAVINECRCNRTAWYKCGKSILRQIQACRHICMYVYIYIYIYTYIQWVPGHFPVVKRPVPGADQPPPFWRRSRVWLTPNFHQFSISAWHVTVPPDFTY